MGSESTPIRVGDRFSDADGRTWEVVESEPFGERTLLDRSRTMFWNARVREIRAALAKQTLSRLSGVPASSRSAER